MVAEEARNLLGNIGNVLNVVSEGGGNDVALAVKREFNLFKDFLLLCLAEVNADEIVNPLVVKFEFNGLLRGRELVNYAVNNVARVKQLNKLKRSLSALSVAPGSSSFSYLLDDSVLIPRAFAVLRIEMRKASGFKNDSGRVVHNSAVFAAHNACYGNGCLSVCDNQHIGIKLTLNAVKSGDGFAVLCVAHVNGVALKVTQVKRVHRLAVFKHNVVCDINDVADWAHAACSQPFSKPARAFLNAHVFNNCA